MTHNHTSESWTEEDQANSEPDFYGKWVELKRIQPAENFKVLISDGDNIGHARMVYGQLQIVASNDFVDMSKVTHWMSLPEPPKAS
tara:strand:- start:248 stop:505 length:258 start_codon:yes stop_codon:yes gene_type:complete